MTEEDAKGLGVELPQNPKKEEDKDEFVVIEDNWETVMMFLRMQTQWTTSMVGYVGLKYEVLLVHGGMFDLYNVENRPQVLEGLQLMEATVLKEVNKSNG